MKKLILISFVVILTGFVGINAGKIAVIANKSLSDEQFDKSKLIDIFTLNKQNWNTGAKVFICEQKGEYPSKNQFYSFLGFSYSDIQKLWIKKQFSGKAMPPRSFNSFKEVVEKVANTPGAIGYVPYEMANSSVLIVTSFN